MPKWRKQLKLPQKLTNFFHPMRVAATKMVPAAFTGTLLSPLAGHSRSQQPEFSLQTAVNSQYSPPCSPSTASPVKSKPRREEDMPGQPHNLSFTLPSPDAQHPSAIDNVSASDQPISEQMMKNMPISLKQTLY